LGLILDTSALSAFADGEPAVVAQVNRANQAALPVIVLGEYRYGIGGSRRRTEYETWLDEFLAASQILDITEATTVVYAKVRAELTRAGTPIPSNDLWIAALCRQHRMPILTRDGHFGKVPGLTLLTW
jgi:predicted nucleic acid-binding protein